LQPGLKQSKKKVHEYSVALAARKATAAELKPKIAYGGAVRVRELS
jgi:hypothetical protein